jgi:hypothetical protein
MRKPPDGSDALDAPSRLFAAEPGPSGRPDAPGRLERIVRRPAVDERETVAEARLETTRGLDGDTWLVRGSRHTVDGSADPDAQVTLISVRVLAAIEPDAERWPLSGDQLEVDLDLSVEALPPGTRLAIGSAVLEVTAKPHTGCAKFSARFGSDALRWINTPEGRLARRRGMNARVVRGGKIRAGDPITRV